MKILNRFYLYARHILRTVQFLLKNQFLRISKIVGVQNYCILNQNKNLNKIVNTPGIPKKKIQRVQKSELLRKRKQYRKR